MNRKTMPDAALQPRKSPRQARASATLEVILEAAARVLSSESLSGFNTNRVAEVAGISVGSLYQYYPNKAALVSALIERGQAGLAEAIERCVAASAGKTLSAALSELIDIAIQHQFGNAVYAAALDHEERRLPLDAVLGASQQRMLSAVQTLIDRHRGAVNASLSDYAALDCLTITKSLVESEAQRSEIDLHLLKQRVLQALNGYLRQQS